jgi:hypothetical protein
MEDKRKELE